MYTTNNGKSLENSIMSKPRSSAKRRHFFLRQRKMFGRPIKYHLYVFVLARSRIFSFQSLCEIHKLKNHHWADDGVPLQSKKQLSSGREHLLDFQKRFSLGLDHDETGDDGPEKVEHCVHVIIDVDAKCLGYFGVGAVQQSKPARNITHSGAALVLTLAANISPMSVYVSEPAPTEYARPYSHSTTTGHHASGWSPGPLANAYRLMPYAAVSAAIVACETNISGFRPIQSTRTMCDSVPMYLDTVNNTTAANGFIQ